MDEQLTITLNSGRTMPVMGLGTWQLTQDTAGMIQAALNIGYTMIDTSGDYGTQPGVGEGLKRAAVPRDSFYLVTKVEETDDAYTATEQNLSELQLEFADLMLIHRPPAKGAGEELWDGLIRARKDGLTRDIGVSNYATDEIEALIAASGVTPAVNQLEWSPFGHSEDMLGFCQEHGIIIQAYSPLTRGKRLDDETLRDIASHYGKTPAQILLRWNLQLGTVPIPKANQLKHLEENFDIFEFEISDDDMATLNGLNEHFSSLGSLPYV